MLIIPVVDNVFHNVRVGDWHALEKILALIFEARRHGLGCGVFLFGNGNQFRDIHHDSEERWILFEKRDDQMPEPATKIGDFFDPTLAQARITRSSAPAFTCSPRPTNSLAVIRPLA